MCLVKLVKLEGFWCMTLHQSSQSFQPLTPLRSSRRKAGKLYRKNELLYLPIFQNHEDVINQYRIELDLPIKIYSRKKGGQKNGQNFAG